MWEWIASLLGITRWMKYMVQAGTVLWSASMIYAAYQTYRTSKARADQAVHTPHLSRFHDTSPPPTRTEVARAATHWLVPIIAAGILIATIAVLWVDFKSHQAERVEAFTAERAVAIAEAKLRCDSKYRLPQCDGWEAAAQWTDAAIAMKAFHSAWSEMGHHVYHDIWEHVPLDWRVVCLILIAAFAYWLWTGPFTGAFQVIDMIRARVKHTYDSTPLADHMTALPTTGSIPYTPMA